MRQILFILTILLFGCSTNEELKNEKTTSEISQEINEHKEGYIITENHSCEQVNLSTQFDLAIDFKRYSGTDERQDSSYLTVYIKDKETQSTLDSFSISSFFYPSGMFSNCDDMTSFTTGFHADREIIDNYHGEIVVADLNFDGLDDIAVIHDVGGNGGPLYSYYMQTTNKKFILDNFLTDSVRFFPAEINSQTRTLTTYVHAGVCGLSEHVYEYDKKSNIWAEKINKIINTCDE